MDDPEGTDPTTFSDLALFGAARAGSSTAAAELRARYQQALRTVAAGYRNRDVDRESLLDQVVDMLDAAPMPTSDGAVPLTLFALVRTARLEAPIVAGRPSGLVDLVGAVGTGSLVAGTDASHRKALLGAYAALDDRDQVLLWFSSVEGTMPKALSGRLAIGGADMASTKTFRARSHLRHAYAERRSAGSDWSAECRSRAAGLARLADREQPDDPSRPDGHVGDCPRCTALLAELQALTGGLLDEAAHVLHGIDTQRVRTGRAVTAPILATAAVATAAEPSTTPIHAADEFDDPDAPGPRGRAYAVAAVGLLAIVAIAAFVIWGVSHDRDQQVQVAAPITARVTRVPITTPEPTASVKSATTSTSTTRRRSTTSTSTTTRTRHPHPVDTAGGGWTPPQNTGASPPMSSAPPASPASTSTTRPTTTTTLITTTTEPVASSSSTSIDSGTP